MARLTSTAVSRRGSESWRPAFQDSSRTSSRRRPVGRVEALGRAEQLLGVALLLRPGRGQGPGVERRGPDLAAVVALDPREDEARARRPADPVRGVVLLEPEDEDVVEPHPLGGVAGEALDGVRRRRLGDARRLDPGFGDGAEVADEVAGRAVRLAPGPGGRELGQPREPEQPLGDLGLGGEQALAPDPDPLDQAADEDVGAALLHRRRGFAVELEEVLDPLAGLGRDPRALERRLAGRDHVELAPPRDRRQPREVGGGQLDRRPGQRPRRRRRVGRVGEHPQPGDRVAHLGPLEERRRPGEVERDPALLHRRRDRPAPHHRVVDQDADVVGPGPAREQGLDLAGDGLGLGALVGAAPEPQLGVAEQVLELDRVAVGVDLAVPAAELGAGRLERVDVARVLAWRARRAAPAGRWSCPRARRPSPRRSARRGRRGRPRAPR